MTTPRTLSIVAASLTLCISAAFLTAVAPASSPEGAATTAKAKKKKCRKGYVRKTVKRGKKRVSVCKKRKGKSTGVDGRYKGDDTVNAVVSGNGTKVAFTIKFFGGRDRLPCPERTVTYPPVPIKTAGSSEIDTARTPTSEHGQQGLSGFVNRSKDGIGYSIVATLGGLEEGAAESCTNYVKNTENGSLTKVK